MKTTISQVKYQILSHTKECALTNNYLLPNLQNEGPFIILYHCHRDGLNAEKKLDGEH